MSKVLKATIFLLLHNALCFYPNGWSNNENELSNILSLSLPTIIII